MVGMTYPLTDGQAQQLIGPVTSAMTLWKEQVRGVPLRGSPLEMREQNFKATEVKTKLLLEATQGFLTPQQYSALKNRLDQQINSTRKGLQELRARQEAAATSSTPPATRP